MTSTTVSVKTASDGTLFPIVKPLFFITLPVVPLNIATCSFTAESGPITPDSWAFATKVCTKPVVAI